MTRTIKNRRRNLAGLISATLLTGLFVASPAVSPAFAEPAAAPSVAAANVPDVEPFTPDPLDPQNWKNQYDMTWADWKDIPDTDWNNPDVKPTKTNLKIALVAVDFPDQPFVITQPKKSDLFGNPQIDPVAREAVPQFYKDFYTIPSEINHGRTVHEYWMEQSRGSYGISTMDTFGPYRMTRNLFEYGLNEFGQTPVCPAGFTCNGNLDNDVRTVWRNALGAACVGTSCGYDVILRIYAGYDETSIWQEFGPMMFETKEDIPDSFGPPAALKGTLNNWAPTRYVEWTSWRAAAQQWGNSSIRQAESSGTITHEMGHFFFSIGDNNNNPFSNTASPPTPFHRVGAAPWDMMDRGSFNGPGGHHMRWVVPANMGGWSPAGLLVRNKLKMGIVPVEQITTVTRSALANSGLILQDVTARAVDPGPGGSVGMKIVFDGTAPVDKTPTCNTNTDPFCAGTGWTDYTVEVVDRMGFDSFTPDSGVIISKNKATTESSGCGYNCFNWVIDANPQDINMVDYYKPTSHTPVMATIADHRQLNDAAFHAGLNSGSEYEWVDTANRLHFYIVNKHRDSKGVLSYQVAVRNLDGAGDAVRGVSAAPTVPAVHTEGVAATCAFPVTNTGTGGSGKSAADVFRLSASAGAGWKADLDNALAAAPNGDTVTVPVYVSRTDATTPATDVTLTAVSESNPAATTTATCHVTSTDLVTRTPSAVALTLTSTSVAAGAAVAVKAEVTSTGSVDGGAVQILDGNEVVAEGAVTAGVFTASVSGLGIGEHPLTAVYSGNDTAAPGASDSQVASVYFTDYPPTRAFYQDVLWMVQNNITQGQTPTSYSPATPVSRQALAAFLYRLANPGVAAPACVAKPFTDVAVDQMFCGEIAWAKAEGITNGNANGSFTPGASITRQATAAFLYRYAHDGADPAACTASNFSDVLVSNQFCAAINWLDTTEITHGFVDGTFRPTNTTNRDAIAAFLHRLSGL